MTQPGHEPPEFMAKEVMKPLLRLARRRAVTSAIAMTRDHAALLFLHRRMKPRRAMQELRQQAVALGLDLNIATLRFGRAQVDGGSDSQKVTFRVNKPLPDAIRRALLVHLRPAGYQRCEVVVDEGLEDETDTDEDAVDEEADEAAMRESHARAGSLGPAPPVHVAAPPQALDPKKAAALRAELADIVKELAAVIVHEHGRENPLVHLAYEAQACLQAGDLVGAAGRIRRLHDGLRAASDDGSTRDGGR